MQIGPRILPTLVPPASRSLPDADSGRRTGSAQADERRRNQVGEAPQRRPAVRILQGELIDDATAGPRDRVHPYRNIDPTRASAILAYEQMQTVSPGPQASAGRYLDLLV